MTFVRPGERVKDYITARWFNEVSKKPLHAGQSLLDTRFGNTVVWAIVDNEDQNTYSPGEAVGIINGYDEPFTRVEQKDLYKESNQHLIGRTTIKKLSPGDVWGVLLDFCDKETPARLAVSGVAWTEVYFGFYNPQLYYCSPGEGRLEGSANGNAILHREQLNSEGVAKCLVLLGPSSFKGKELYYYTLLEDFSSGVARALLTSYNDNSSITSEGEVRDPSLIFSFQKKNESGIAIGQGSLGFAIQAFCSNENTCCCEGGGPTVNQSIIYP